MPSSFLQFGLPTPGAWLYATLALSIAVYFQFHRIVSLRNLDLLGLFLYSPGYLIVDDAGGDPGQSFVGYLWLLVVCGFWFVRALLDITAVKRPRIPINLSTSGLSWLAGTLLLGLCMNSAAKKIEPPTSGKTPTPLNGVKDGVAAAMQSEPSEEIRWQVSRIMAIVCQIAVAILILLIGKLHFRESTLGAGAAALYLLLPFTSFRFEQSHHVWPTVFLLAALLAYRRPSAAGLLLGIAAGTSFFPVVLLPAWLQFYRGRGMGPFSIGFGVSAGVSLAITVPALVFVGDFTSGIWQTLNLADWVPWRAVKLDGIWLGAHWAYRLPVFIVFAMMMLASFIWPTIRDLGQLISANAVLLIGIQFWFADRGGSYVLWFAPLLILMILRPSTTELQPSIASRSAWHGWLRRRKSGTIVAPPSLAV